MFALHTSVARGDVIVEYLCANFSQEYFEDHYLLYRRTRFVKGYLITIVVHESFINATVIDTSLGSPITCMARTSGSWPSNLSTSRIPSWIVMFHVLLLQIRRLWSTSDGRLEMGSGSDCQVSTQSLLF